jgi:hypothetical protein
MSSMQSSDVTQERLQRLAAVQAPDGCRVLSLYLNLDPQANLSAPCQPAHGGQLAARRGLARRRGRGGAQPRGAHGAARGRLARPRGAGQQPRRRLGRGRARARDLRLRPRELFDVVRLPRPLDNRVLIAARPPIEPLASEIGTADRWAVLLLDGDDARLLEGLRRPARGDRGDRGRPARPHADRAACPRSATSAASAWRSNEFLAAARRDAARADERARSAHRDRHRPSACTQSWPATSRAAQGGDHRPLRRGRRTGSRPTTSATKVEPLLQRDETHREKAAIDQASPAACAASSTRCPRSTSAASRRS